MLEILGNIPNKDIVGHQFLLVGTKQLLVKLEASAWLALDLEVLHLLAGQMEVGGVLDAHDRGEEGPSDVLTDLRLRVQTDSGFLFESHRDAPRVSFLSWKVIKVDQVLILVLHEN